MVRINMTQRILAARFAIVSREQFDPCRTVSIDMLPVSAIGLRMVAAANLVEVAALVGDTARATMLNALMGGQSLTATELAYGRATLSEPRSSAPPDARFGEDRPRYRID